MENKTKKNDNEKIIVEINNKRIKKAFTLIELLAVIIILGVLMIIAIPAVTSYISDSRKNAYVDTSKELIAATRTKINEGKLNTYDMDVTYYIPSKCIPTETGEQSPYGEFTQAYIGVIYEGNNFKYYWISNDTSGQGIKKITAYNDLDKDNIEAGIKDSEILETIESTGIEGRKTIKILKDDCKNWNTNKKATKNLGSDGVISDVVLTGADNISELSGLIEVDDEKIFVTQSPYNYVKFNGDELWRIISVYGNRLKIIRNNGVLSYKFNFSPSKGNAWLGSDLYEYLNDTYYNSMTQTAKNMIDEGTWNAGAITESTNAYNTYLAAKALQVNGKVGLLSGYEYLYAAGNDPACLEKTGSQFAYTTCASTNWLKSVITMSTQSKSWTINPNYNSVDSFVSSTAILLVAGSIKENCYITDTGTILPVVYLKSSVKIIGGTGKSFDPYILE